MKEKKKAVKKATFTKSTSRYRIGDQTRVFKFQKSLRTINRTVPQLKKKNTARKKGNLVKFFQPMVHTYVSSIVNR